MRKPTSSAVLGLVSATAMTCLVAAQAPPKSSEPPRAATISEISINGAADLEHLREANFRDYLRVKQILAAANEICRTKLKPTYLIRFNDAHPTCDLLWMTSLPPKRLLRFQLHGVYYTAVVTITNNTARALRVTDHAKH